MKKQYKEKLDKIFNELTKLIENVDEYYYQEYKKIINKNKNKRRKCCKIFDIKKQRNYSSMNMAILATGHSYQYIKNHPELYITEEK